GPALQLADDRGDALQLALLVGELGTVPSLERRQPPPQRLALQLQLGHLVPQRLKLSEEALEAIAEWGRRKDDGGRSGAGHGRGRRALPEFSARSAHRRMCPADLGSALVRIRMALALFRLDLLRLRSLLGMVGRPHGA